MTSLEESVAEWETRKSHYKKEQSFQRDSEGKGSKSVSLTFFSDSLSRKPNLLKEMGLFN